MTSPQRWGNLGEFAWVSMRENPPIGGIYREHVCYLCHLKPKFRRSPTSQFLFGYIRIYWASKKQVTPTQRRMHSNWINWHFTNLHQSSTIMNHDESSAICFTIDLHQKNHRVCSKIFSQKSPLILSMFREPDRPRGGLERWRCGRGPEKDPRVWVKSSFHPNPSWWVVTGCHFLTIFPEIIGNCNIILPIIDVHSYFQRIWIIFPEILGIANHPNGRTNIFFRGGGVFPGPPSSESHGSWPSWLRYLQLTTAPWALQKTWPKKRWSVQESWRKKSKELQQKPDVPSIFLLFFFNVSMRLRRWSSHRVFFGVHPVASRSLRTVTTSESVDGLKMVIQRVQMAWRSTCCWIGGIPCKYQIIVDYHTLIIDYHRLS